MGPKPKKPRLPPRPRLSAYFIFSEEIRSKMTEEQLTVNHQHARGVIQKLWNNLPAEKKQLFQNRVDRGVQQHAVEMKKYEASLASYEEELKQWKADHGRKVKPLKATDKRPPSNDPDNDRRLERNREAQKRRRAKRMEEETEDERQERLMKERERVKKYRRDRARFDRVMVDEDYSALPEETIEMTLDEAEHEILQFDEDLLDVGMNNVCSWAGITREQLRDPDDEVTKKIAEAVAAAQPSVDEDDDQNDEEWDGDDMIFKDDDEEEEEEEIKTETSASAVV